MGATFSMYSWNHIIVQGSFALTLPLAIWIFKADGAYIRSCNNDGLFLSISDNGTWNCVPCTTCPEGTRVTQPCRYNRDTVCEKCPPDTYVAEAGDKCEPCTRCRPGQYVEKYCYGNQNRRCKTCAQGYYSHHWNSVSCQRCKHCRRREMVVRQCDRQKNSICGGCEKGYYRESSTLACVPCSECVGEDFVTVRECIRKMGENSLFICQLRAFMLREKESQTTVVEVTKISDSNVSEDILTITISALLVVVGCVLLSFVIAVIYWRCSSIVLFSRWTNSRANSQMIPSYNHFELASENCTRYDIPKRARADLVARFLDETTTKQELSDSLGSDCGTISDKEDMIGCGSLSDISDQTQDTLSLLSCQENPSPRVHRKKKKRRPRHEYWQSDSDIVTENRYAVLDAAKFTTI